MRGADLGNRRHSARACGARWRRHGRLEVSIPGTAPKFTSAELYTAEVEFAATMQRRSD
jgi:hypothetical protein